MKSFSLFLVLAFLAFACQMQDDPSVLSDDASSGGPSTPPPAMTDDSWVNSYTTSADGKTLTLTITSSTNAKAISHVNFKFNSCAGTGLGTANITSFTANGVDMTSNLSSSTGNGDDCFGLLANPFVKLDQGFPVGTVVLVIGFDTPLSNGVFLIKAASGNGNSGGGCFGLNNPNYSISRDCTPPPTCYQEDTGWATGPRYVSRGNWATYTPYAAGPVNIYAGQTKFAGTATLSAVSGGNVTITIALNTGWSLQNVSNPVKINGYNATPSGNPSPGRFASKGSSLTVSVPAAAFYGIHLDLQQAVACPE